MRYFVYFIMIPFLATSVAADVTRDLPNIADQGETITVTLELSDVPEGTRVVIGELIPYQSTLLEWNVEGASNSPQPPLMDRTGREVIWDFTAATSNPRVIYEVQLPEIDRAVFDAVYAHSPDTFGRQRDTLLLFAPQEEIILEQPEQVNLIEESPAPILIPETPPEEPVRDLRSFFLFLFLLGIGLIVGYFWYGRNPPPPGAHAKKKNDNFLTSFKNSLKQLSANLKQLFDGMDEGVNFLATRWLKPQEVSPREREEKDDFL